MQPSLILVLLIEMGLCALAFYLGFIRPARVLRHLPQTAFLILGLLSAFIIWVLYDQTLAESRLEDAGITPHPKLSHAVGYANGRGENPVWLFQASAPPEPVLDFYRNETNREGWSLVSDSALLLVLEKDDHRLAIGAVEKGAGASVSFLSSSPR